MALLAETISGNGVPTLWPLAESYRWMSALSRLGWAWEFLRRNPAYLDAFYAAASAADGSARERDKRALIWGLLRFENPTLDARRANVFWLLEACREVLPLTAAPMQRGAEANTLRFDTLQCRTTLCSSGDDQRQDVLFAQEGRFLQLSILGNTPLDEALLLTPALPSPTYRDKRLLAVRRLTDLVEHQAIRPSLYPRERRAPRLMRVAQALDGWLAQASYRDIAVALFGLARVERDWRDPRDHLRDHVRRAIRYGRDLMNTGYRQFLV